MVDKPAIAQGEKDPFKIVFVLRWLLERASDLVADLAGKQPLDADLTAIAALSGTNTIYYRSGTDAWSAVTIGANLTFTGGTLAASGVVLQEIYAESTAWTTGTTAMAGAIDTIPQQTDGTQLLTATITPLNASNQLRIGVSGTFSANTLASFWTAVFRDATAAALASNMITPPGSAYYEQVTFSFQVPAGSTASTTFKLRVGNMSGTASTWAVNGNAATRVLGGSQRVTLTIIELKP